MSNLQDKNICRSVFTLEDYLNSCPFVKADFRAIGLISKLTSLSNAGRGIHYAFGFLKNNWEDNGFIDYIKHPQKMFEDAARSPSSETTNGYKRRLSTRHKS